MVKKIVWCLMACYFISAQALNDPTRPAGILESSDVSVETEGANMVLVAKQRQIALVHGKYVKVGDSVKEGDVIAITDRGVEVINLKTGKLTILSVMSDPIRKGSKE